MTRCLLLGLFALTAPATDFSQFRRPPDGREKLPTIPSVLIDDKGKPVTDPVAWKGAREHLLRQWQQIIGPFPERVPLATRVISTEELADHTRILVRYQADPTWEAE